MIPIGAKLAAGGLFPRCLEKLWKTTYRVFSIKGVPPPPTPLTETHFAENPLAEMGGTPSPPLTESPLSFSGIFFSLED